jgi:hypothetical protein
MVFVAKAQQIVTELSGAHARFPFGPEKRQIAQARFDRSRAVFRVALDLFPMEQAPAAEPNSSAQDSA